MAQTLKPLNIPAIGSRPRRSSPSLVALFNWRTVAMPRPANRPPVHSSCKGFQTHYRRVDWNSQSPEVAPPTPRTLRQYLAPYRTPEDTYPPLVQQALTLYGDPTNQSGPLIRWAVRKLKDCSVYGRRFSHAPMFLIDGQIDAEDVVHEAFVRCLPKLANPEDEIDNLPGYLSVVLGRVIHDLEREFYGRGPQGETTRRRNIPVPLDAAHRQTNRRVFELVPCPVGIPGTDLEAQAVCELLNAALSTLPDRPQQAWRMVYAGKNHREIAEALGVTREAVTKMLNRSRSALQRAVLALNNGERPSFHTPVYGDPFQGKVSPCPSMSHTERRQ